MQNKATAGSPGSFWRLEGIYGKVFIALLVFSFVYASGILRANVYYMDDLFRSQLGDAAWSLNGRPLMSLLTTVLCGGSPLMDFSPWAQLTFGLALSYSLVLWGRKFLPEMGWLRLAGILSFVYLNLFLLENISYKFDALGMGLALALPFLIFALPEGLPKGRLAAASILGIMALLSLYQAALGAYLGLMVLESIFYMRWGRSLRELGRLLGYRLAFLLAGGILYKLLIANLLVPQVGEYSSGHVAMVSPFTAEGLSVLYANLLAFGQLLQEYVLSIRWPALALTLALLISMGVELRRLWDSSYSRQEKRCLSALVLLAPIALVLFSFGPLLLLQSSVVAPRTMLSFSVFTLYVGVMVSYLDQLKGLGRVLTCLTGAVVLSFACAYGNLLSCQDRVDYLLQSYVVRDIDELEQANGCHYEWITYIGSSPRSIELLYVREQRPLMDTLVRTQDWWTGGMYLGHLRMTRMLSDYKDKIWEYGRDHAPLKENEYYKMYLKDQQIIVEYKEKSKKW